MSIYIVVTGDVIPIHEYGANCIDLIWSASEEEE